MATTPNYGWVTPAPTDYLVDLPADFETFADAVDADLAGLLGGTTGQVLAKDSDADHDFSWIAAPTGGSWTQAATGSLTGSTITISALSGQKYFVILDGISTTNTDNTKIRLNGDTGSNYYWNGTASGQDSFLMSGDLTAASAYRFSLLIDLADTAAQIKPVIPIGQSIAAQVRGGSYKSTSAITSITLFTGDTFDAGTYYVWSFD